MTPIAQSTVLYSLLADEFLQIDWRLVEQVSRSEVRNENWVAMKNEKRRSENSISGHMGTEYTLYTSWSKICTSANINWFVAKIKLKTNFACARSKEMAKDHRDVRYQFHRRRHHHSNQKIKVNLKQVLRMHFQVCIVESIMSYHLILPGIFVILPLCHCFPLPFSFGHFILIPFYPKCSSNSSSIR